MVEQLSRRSSSSRAEEVTLEEHERLIACIARHDPDGAEQAIREHLTRANQSYRSAH